MSESREADDIVFLPYSIGSCTFANVKGKHSKNPTLVKSIVRWTKMLLLEF